MRPPCSKEFRGCVGVSFTVQRWGTAVDTSRRELGPNLEMPASEQMKSIFRRGSGLVTPLQGRVSAFRHLIHSAMDLPSRQRPLSRRRHASQNRSAKSAGVDPRRDATSRVVNACGYPMTAVGFHGGAATAKSGEEEDRAEGE